MHQEGHVLVSRKACSRMLKGLFLSVEGHGQDGRGTKIVYRFSVMSWREEDRRASSSCLERGDERKSTTCNAGDAQLKTQSFVICTKVNIILL